MSIFTAKFRKTCVSTGKIISTASLKNSTDVSAHFSKLEIPTMLGGEIWEQPWVQIWGELDQQLAICASFTALSGHHNHCTTLAQTPRTPHLPEWPLTTMRANTKTTDNTANSSNQLYQDPPLTTLTLAQPQPRPLPSLASPGHFPKITINKSATIYLPPLQS